MFKLVISDDEGKTIIVPLVRDLITIGRQEGNTIRLTERNVSRQHARLVKVNDHFRIEDLDAYNGVRVNDERVKGARDLADGDRIGIGDYLLAVRLSDAAVAPETKPQPRVGPPPPPPPAGSSTASPARLVMVSAPAPGAEFVLEKDSVRVGRLEELDLCISHRSISREHAQIDRTGDEFSVRDLESANGIRVNGALLKTSSLKSGDLLDLGQVRFRFVGPGEAYTFDADEIHTVAETAVMPTYGRARTAVIVGSAVVIAGALALWGSDAEPPQTLPVQSEPVAAPEVVQGTGLDDSAEVAVQVAAALEGCRSATDAQRYDEAVKSAQNGLMLDASDTELAACRDAAKAGLREVSAFEQGKAAYEAGDVDGAYLLFAGLAQDSGLRADPVVAAAVQAYARGQLNEAERQLPGDPDEAARLATEVEGMEDADAALRQEGAALRKRAERAAALAETAPAATRRLRKRAKPDHEPPSETDANEGLVIADSPAKQARSCLARGDQKCAVRALEGRARTAQELALLIETYRALGDTQRAVRSMQQFVKRYPSAPQSGGYKTFIARNSP